MKTLRIILVAVAVLAFVFGTAIAQVGPRTASGQGNKVAETQVLRFAPTTTYIGTKEYTYSDTLTGDASADTCKAFSVEGCASAIAFIQVNVLDGDQTDSIFVDAAVAAEAAYPLRFTSAVVIDTLITTASDGDSVVFAIDLIGGQTAYLMGGSGGLSLDEVPSVRLHFRQGDVGSGDDLKIGRAIVRKLWTVP